MVDGPVRERRSLVGAVGGVVSGFRAGGVARGFFGLVKIASANARALTPLVAFVLEADASAEPTMTDSAAATKIAARARALRLGAAPNANLPGRRRELAQRRPSARGGARRIP